MDYSDLWLDSVDKTSSKMSNYPRLQKKTVRFHDDQGVPVHYANHIPYCEPVNACSDQANSRNKSMSCGCVGGFLAELIPAAYSDYFMNTGASNNTVSHTYVNTNTQTTFNQAFWAAFNHAAFGLCKQYSMDYCIGIYQIHQKNCFKQYTRYTAVSVRKLAEYFYTRSATHISECHLCFCPEFQYICFKCLQSVLELHISTCPKISELFQIQIYYKAEFCNSNGIIQNKFFTARALLESSSLAKSTKVRDKPYCVKFYWDPQLIHDERVNGDANFGDCYCLYCFQPGNGRKLFICQFCASTECFTLF